LWFFEVKEREGNRTPQLKNNEISKIGKFDNWGVGVGGAYSYIRVLPDGFLLKAIVFTVCELNMNI
jgi:hypothetical protein